VKCVRSPNVENAVVTQQKIVDYLLRLEHPDGWSKAVFFGRFGFRPEGWRILAEALIDVARRNDVVSVAESPWGCWHVVEGARRAPDRRQPMIRTVWIIEEGDSARRLVTVHPL